MCKLLPKLKTSLYAKGVSQLAASQSLNVLPVLWSGCGLSCATTTNLSSCTWVLNEFDSYLLLMYLLDKLLFHLAFPLKAAVICDAPGIRNVLWEEPFKHWEWLDINMLIFLVWPIVLLQYCTKRNSMLKKVFRMRCYWHFPDLVSLATLHGQSALVSWKAGHVQV